MYLGCFLFDVLQVIIKIQPIVYPDAEIFVSVNDRITSDVGSGNCCEESSSIGASCQLHDSTFCLVDWRAVLSSPSFDYVDCSVDVQEVLCTDCQVVCICE